MSNTTGTLISMTQTLKKFSKTVSVREMSSDNTLPAQESRALSLNADAVATLMFTLTDMYSDPNLAILREYTTNARDSHMRAKQKRPIEVTLPSFNSPTFIVRDFGVGMSKHDLLHVYPQFGNTTKADDMAQVGAYGLGCKCALTLVDQFTIESVKDGMRTLAVMSRNDRGGTMDILSHESTEDANGTVVSITLPNASVFNGNAETFFSTWKPDTVLVNGEKPLKSIYNSGYHKHKNILIKPQSVRYGRNQLFLMVDGFAYRVKDELTRGIRMDAHYSNQPVNVYVEVPIGLVDFTPARETLRYTERVNRLINETTTYLSNHMGDIIREHIAAAKTRADAIARTTKWNIADNAEPRPTWKGEAVLNALDLGSRVATLTRESGTDRFKRDYQQFIPIAQRGLNNSRICIVTGEAPVGDAYMTRVVKSEFDLHSNQDSAIVYFVEDKKKVQSRWLLENENVTMKDATAIHASYKERQAVERKNRPARTRSSVPQNKLNDSLYYRALHITPDGAVKRNLTLNAFDALEGDKKHVYYVSTQEMASGFLDFRYMNTQQIEYAVLEGGSTFKNILEEGAYLFIITAPRTAEAFARRFSKALNIEPQNAVPLLADYVKNYLKRNNIDAITLGLLDGSNYRTIELLSHLSEDAQALLSVPIRQAIKSLDKFPSGSSYDMLSRHRRELGDRAGADATIKSLSREYPLIKGVLHRYLNEHEAKEIASDLALYMLAKKKSM